MPVSVSQKFVHYWVKTGKEKGFLIYIKQGQIHNKSNSIWVKKQKAVKWILAAILLKNISKIFDLSYLWNSLKFSFNSVSVFA